MYDVFVVLCELRETQLTTLESKLHCCPGYSETRKETVRGHREGQR